MTATTPSSVHARNRRAIAAHFAGRISTGTEAAMRAHLLDCPSCKSHYQRHLVLARLDPRALPVSDRIARGLGFRLRASGGRGWRARLFAGLAVSIAAATVLAISPVRKPNSGSEPERALAAKADFVARGTGTSDGHAASFWTYRLGREGAPRLVDEAITRGDELAFAYSNPAGKPFLMIFGVDEHRHVYWFHPAWPAGQPAPAAIRVAPGAGPHELPDAIHHALDGQRLRIYAAFSDRTLEAQTVEAIARLPGRSDELPESLPKLGEGVVVIGRTYEVRP